MQGLDLRLLQKAWEVCSLSLGAWRVKNMVEQQNKLIIFQSKAIRRVWHDDEWYYSLVDVLGALTGSANPTDYLKKIRKRDEELGFYIGTICPQVTMGVKQGIKKSDKDG